MGAPARCAADPVWRAGSPGRGAGWWGARGPARSGAFFSGQLLQRAPALGPAASHVPGEPAFLPAAADAAVSSLGDALPAAPPDAAPLGPAFSPGLWDLGGRERCDRKPLACGRGF